MSDLPKQPPPQFDPRQKAPPQESPPARSTRRGGRGRARAGMTTETRISTQSGSFVPLSGPFTAPPYAPYTGPPHPSPTRLPPLTIPPPNFTRPVYHQPSPPPILPQPYRSQHAQNLPQPTQPRIGSLINEATPWTPPGSGSPYSPRYPAQVSPRREPGPQIGQKRPSEPYQHEDPRHREPPLPSPGYSEHRESWSAGPSHRGSAASSTGFGPHLPLPIPSSGGSSVQEPSRSHRSSGQSSTGFPGSVLQPRSSSTQPSISTTTSQHVVPTTATGPVSDPPTGRHQLYIRQQPIAARACGFGERDRRVIDPPPILQLLLANFDPTLQVDVDELRMIYVVHVNLHSADGKDTNPTSSNDVTIMREPYNKPSRRLMGTLVASPFHAQDPEPDKAPTFHLAAPTSTSASTPQTNAQISHLISAQTSETTAPHPSSTPSPTTTTITEPSRPPPNSTFFLFPDLSCRTPGHYRLHFQLFRITPELTSTPGFMTRCIAEATSDVFEVFAAKDFPGMRTSTTLTVGLKKAGAGIGLKKGAATGRGGKDEESGEEGSAGDKPPVKEEEASVQGGRMKATRRGRRGRKS